VSRVSDLGDLEAKLAAFGWYVARCDGHDAAQLRETFAALRAVADKPKIVIADTVKGKGVSFMEHTAMPAGEKLYRFHSGAPSDDVYARALEELAATADAALGAAGADALRLETAVRPERPAVVGLQRMMPAYSEALIEQATANPRIVALDADLVLDTGLIPFQERFPERFIECGIAEQDMVSQASGLALQGMLPVVHSFACFLSTRPNEQIYNNATERTRIMYVGSLAGLLPAGPGHSHQSVRDISALGAMPGLVMIEPCDEREVALAVEYCLTRAEESSYLRLVSIPCAVPYELPAGYELRLGQGVALSDGDDAVIFGYGPVMLAQAYHAADRLKREHGIRAKVVNLPWLNRVDAAWLESTIGRSRWVFTIDDHFLVGGQGEMIAARIAEHAPRLSVSLHRFGLTGIPLCGQNDEVLRAHGLDAESLATEIAGRMVRTPA
jgi:transketolase